MCNLSLLTAIIDHHRVVRPIAQTSALVAVGVLAAGTHRGYFRRWTTVVLVSAGSGVGSP